MACATSGPSRDDYPYDYLYDYIGRIEQHYRAQYRPHNRLVRRKGLEPPRLAALEPKSSASTNSATLARRHPASRRACKTLQISVANGPAFYPKAPYTWPLLMTP
jgi:hypothetical protein